MRVDPADPVVALGPLPVAVGKASHVEVRWGLPSGTGVNEEAPVRLVWTSMQGLRRLPDAIKMAGGQAQRGFSFSVEPEPGAATAELTGVLQLVTCDDVKHRICVPVRRTVKAAFEIGRAADGAAVVLELPEAR